MLFSLLKRLGIGVIYGVGIGVGLLATLFISAGGIGHFGTPAGFQVGSGTAEVASQQRLASLSEQLVFVSKPATVTSFGTLAVAGSVENKGPALPGYVNVYADFFEADGNFLYQCMHQFSGGIAAGAKEYFVVECHGMNKELAPKYASHKLHARLMR